MLISISGINVAGFVGKERLVQSVCAEGYLIAKEHALFTDILQTRTFGARAARGQNPTRTKIKNSQYIPKFISGNQHLLFSGYVISASWLLLFSHLPVKDSLGHVSSTVKIMHLHVCLHCRRRDGAVCVG